VSFFTKIRDFAEEVAGGAAIGTFGIPLPGQAGELERQVGGAVLLLAGGEAVLATSAALGANATAIAGAGARLEASHQADMKHAQEIAQQAALAKSQAQARATVRGFQPALPVRRVPLYLPSVPRRTSSFLTIRR
jgi:hypothetical protein